MKLSKNIKKGSNVKVLSGKDKNKEGVILSVLRNDHKVVVKGINIRSKHIKKSERNAGGIIKREMPIDISNIKLLDKSTK